MTKRTFWLLLGALIVLSVGIVGWKYFAATTRVISSFEECAAAGYPVMESYPERCRTPEGKNFVRQVTQESITVTGEAVCLPHKNSRGPQTLECAYGIKSETGVYYGLKDAEMKYLNLLQFGKKIAVTGNLTQAPESIYDIVGTLEITGVTQL